MSLIVKKNLTKKKDHMILFIFLLLTVAILSFTYREKIYNREVQKLIADGFEKYREVLRKPF